MSFHISAWEWDWGQLCPSCDLRRLQSPDPPRGGAGPGEEPGWPPGSQRLAQSQGRSGERRRWPCPLSCWGLLLSAMRTRDSGRWDGQAPGWEWRRRVRLSFGGGRSRLTRPLHRMRTGRLSEAPAFAPFRPRPHSGDPSPPSVYEPLRLWAPALGQNQRGSGLVGFRVLEEVRRKW